MAIFNSYVSLLEGIYGEYLWEISVGKSCGKSWENRVICNSPWLRMAKATYWCVFVIERMDLDCQ